MAHTPHNLALDHTLLSHQRGTATGDFQEGQTVLKMDLKVEFFCEQ